MAYALLSTIMIMNSMLSTAVICCHLAMLSKVIVVLFRFKRNEWRNDRLPDVSVYLHAMMSCSGWNSWKVRRNEQCIRIFDSVL